MILSVLKVIGIIFLVIIVLIIFVLCILLFVPIRYQFAGEYDRLLQADVLVRWRAVFLKATVMVKDNHFEYIVKLLGGIVLTNTDARISWIGRKFFSFDEEVTEDKKASTDKEFDKKSKSDFIVLEDSFEEDEFVNLESEREQSEPKCVPKRHVKKKRKSLADIIQDKIKSIREWFRNFMDKLKKLNQKKEALLKVYHSKRFEVAKRDVVTYIKKLFSIIKPDELEGVVHFGLEDPANTGQLLGIMAMALPYYDSYLEIVPDFERACLDGYLKGKGKFSLFPLALLLLKILFNKNLIKVIKKVQTIIEA